MKKQTLFTYLLTYGAEPFLRSCQLCSYSRTSQHFKEPEGSLPCSQEPSTGPYAGPDRCSPYHPISSLLSKIYFNIVTDLLKALRDSGRRTVDCLGSGHVVPQQDDATVLWKHFLRVRACTCDVMLYSACTGDVRQQRYYATKRLRNSRRPFFMPSVYSLFAG
jgi:hypothetical protein